MSTLVAAVLKVAKVSPNWDITNAASAIAWAAFDNESAAVESIVEAWMNGNLKSEEISPAGVEIRIVAQTVVQVKLVDEVRWRVAAADEVAMLM